MIDNLPKFFIRRPTLFWSLVVGIIAYGVISYIRMPKLEDPAVPIKQLSVVALYPGSDLSTIELEVAVPLEDALRTLPDVKKIRTDLMPGRALIGVEFAKEMPMREIEQHFDMARRKVSDASLALPSGVTPIVIDDMMDVYGLLYAFYGDGYSYKELEKYAKLLRRELLTVPGVKRVNIGGTQSEVINVDFTPEFIKANGLMPTQLMMALQSTTGTIDAGRALSGSQRVSLQVTEGVTTVEDIENILISTPEGKKVRVGDIAKVSRQYADPRTNAVY
ncbi:MAG: efflux RND transporter permease subunit, partial [Duncaniella sp.]|nr:efflux RND transporter permease subunit [Duncaniella sp.]